MNFLGGVFLPEIITLNIGCHAVSFINTLSLLKSLAGTLFAFVSSLINVSGVDFHNYIHLCLSTMNILHWNWFRLFHSHCMLQNEINGNTLYYQKEHHTHK